MELIVITCEPNCNNMNMTRTCEHDCDKLRTRLLCMNIIVMTCEQLN